MSFKLLKRTPVHEGRILKFYEDKVLLPNGNESKFDFIKHPGAVAIVPVIDDQIVLVHQFRYAIGGYIYEIPAGKMDIDGESPEDCARRELAEEVGYTADELKPIIKIYTTPGFCDETIQIYLATGLKKGKTHHERNEIMDITPFSIKDVQKMIKNGEISDSKTISGICVALSHLEISF